MMMIHHIFINHILIILQPLLLPALLLIGCEIYGQWVGQVFGGGIDGQRMAVIYGFLIQQSRRLAL